MRFEFDDVTLDTVTRRLTIRGERIDLPPRLFATLQTLLERHDDVVSRADLKAAVWPDTHVESNSVSQAIRAVRGALSSTGAADRIRTVPRRGYCFAGPVRAFDESAEELRTDAPHGMASAPLPWIQTTIVACTFTTVLCLLLITSGPFGPPREPPSMKSAAAYQEGVALAATRRASDLRGATERFMQAVSLDPRNYEALTALAQTHYLLGFYGIATERDARQLARSAVDAAIELAPDRPAAYVLRATLALDTEWDLSGSASDFRRALTLDGRDAFTRHWAAWWCLAADRMSDARGLLDAAVQLDPFSAVILTARATFAYLDGDFHAAAADARRALVIDPKFFRAQLRLGLVQLASGDLDGGIARLGTAHRLAPDIPETAAALAHAYALSGQERRARQILAENTQLSQYDRAIVLTGLGMHAEALAALAAARQRRQLVPGLFAYEPRLAPLRGLRQFQELRAEKPGSGSTSWEAPSRLFLAAGSIFPGGRAGVGCRSRTCIQ